MFFHERAQISMAVCSILYQLATRQAEQEKVYQELCRVIPDPNTPLTYQTLEQCHYLKAFIKEVFRCVIFYRFFYEFSFYCAFKYAMQMFQSKECSLCLDRWRYVVD